MVVFIFSDLDWKYPFGANLVQKNKFVSLSWKFGTKTNSNMQNLLVLLTFSVFDWKYLFRGKFYP